MSHIRLFPEGLGRWELAMITVGGAASELSTQLQADLQFIGPHYFSILLAFLWSLAEG